MINAPVLNLPDRDASVIFMFRAVSCKILKKYLKKYPLKALLYIVEDFYIVQFSTYIRK